MLRNLQIVALLTLIFVCKTTHGVWSCNGNADCSDLEGSICSGNSCVCPLGQEIVLGGTRCADVAPYYHLSSCFDDFQCTRLLTGFACNRDGDEQGRCGCAPNHHYFLGRCWPSRDFAESCTRNEECQNELRNPYSMQCRDGHCDCADGYYFRQRGECRRIGQGVGDGCVLHADCQFENGACDHSSLTCYNTLEGVTRLSNVTKQSSRLAHVVESSTRQDGVACGTGCSAPFVCATQNVCVCPIGYYPSADGSTCLAHLTSPSTNEQCTGLLAQVIDGICTCPPNFYFDINMRDCIKAVLRFPDACVNDEMCLTFGSAGFCGPPEGVWEQRSCDCDPEHAVRVEQLEMCRLFVAVGEECEADNDCMAGQLEIGCLEDDEGIRRCTCPPGLTPSGGLCLTSGLELGDTCQVTDECSITEHAVCLDSVCVCSIGFQQNENICAPEIGSPCIEDDNCIIDNTVCLQGNNNATCQCRDGFLEHEDGCLQESPSYNSSCILSMQCSRALGEGGACVDNACLCQESYHHANGWCWRSIGIYGPCSRSTDCYLGYDTDRVVCRNLMCQCDFNYYYIEEENACDSAGSIMSNLGIILLAILSVTFIN